MTMRKVCPFVNDLSLLSLCIQVILVSTLVEGNNLRHQRHRERENMEKKILSHSNETVATHSSQIISNRSDPDSMSMSTGGRGCLGPDCLSPPQNPSSQIQQLRIPPIVNSSSSSQVFTRVGRQAAQNRNSKGKCLQEIEERRRLSGASSSTSTTNTEYIPKCRPDGSYAQVQCHPQTNSCWCVTRGGRPIPGSSVLGKNKPNCAKYLGHGKSATMRRSSRGKKNRSSCNYADRSRFNAALLRSFRSEYNRFKSSSSYYDSDEANDEIVLSWKFDNLDRDRDGILYRNETLILKEVVKQQIQPRACAKNFISFCAKEDKKIIKREWLDCLRLPSSDGGSSPARIHPSKLLKPGSSSGSGVFGGFPVGASSSSSGTGNGVPRNNPLNPLSPGKGITETQETSNCWTDRQSALASQIRNESVIIPECTASGLYHKVQCAQGRTYCWCVEEESGIQILNSLVVNTVPDCNKRYSKPMKGCSGQKKQKFLTDFLDSLMKKLTNAVNEGRMRIPHDQNHLSVQEQAARWYFTQLDLNQNGILERPEWKKFRAEVSRDKRLKQCGKKLPRHCDGNTDRKLTMTEWVDCLGVELFTTKAANSGGHGSSGHNLSGSGGRRRGANGRRNGKNPFTNILKQR